MVRVCKMLQFLSFRRREEGRGREGVRAGIGAMEDRLGVAVPVGQNGSDHVSQARLEMRRKKPTSSFQQPRLKTSTSHISVQDTG